MQVPGLLGSLNAISWAQEALQRAIATSAFSKISAFEVVTLCSRNFLCRRKRLSDQYPPHPVERIGVVSNKSGSHPCSPSASGAVTVGTIAGIPFRARGVHTGNLSSLSSFNFPVVFIASRISAASSGPIRSFSVFQNSLLLNSSSSTTYKSKSTFLILIRRPFPADTSIRTTDVIKGLAQK